MRNDLLEYIKVLSFVVIAISLSVIAWNSLEAVTYLQGIEERLSSIRVALHQ
ncbi:MAG: hypothetical protein AB2392_14115 [Neobacillus sp.]